MRSRAAGKILWHGLHYVRKNPDIGLVTWSKRWDRLAVFDIIARCMRKRLREGQEGATPGLDGRRFWVGAVRGPLIANRPATRVVSGCAAPFLGASYACARLADVGPGTFPAGGLLGCFARHRLAPSTGPICDGFCKMSVTVNLIGRVFAFDFASFTLLYPVFSLGSQVSSPISSIWPAPLVLLLATGSWVRWQCGVPHGVGKLAARHKFHECCEARMAYENKIAIIIKDNLQTGRS